MPRAWFRHDSQMRYDPAVERLTDDFGPAGDLIWRRLLEVRCQADRELDVTIDGLASMLAIRPSWNLDLTAWLTRAEELKLIKLRQGRDNRVVVRILRWDKHQPAFERTDYAREKKRRQRAGKSPGTRAGQDGDVPPASRSTDVTKQDVTKQDGTRRNDARARDSETEERSQAPEETNGHGKGMPADVRAHLDELGRKKSMSRALEATS